LRIPSIVFNEDDFSVNKLFCKSAYPFASWIVSPEVCDVGKYRLKKIAYPGYQKLAYLHPSCFTPNEEVVRRINPDMDRYFVIRQVSFLAGHDIEKSHGGFSRPLLREIISLLESRGKVFMTSEGRLGDEFKPYELRIEPKNLHHILFYADLFIGDSQSVTMEAALLGTPAIRFNSFVGKISVLEELEKVYRLTAGVKNTEPAALINLVKSLLGRPGLKAEFRERRFRMLKEKIDVTAFLTWFFEAYPQSAKIVRADPCYTSRFLTTAPYLP
jgi:predicted glycosyltransferase